MLTALEIENFKGIAARQRIDFAPLTLLFGANSAGKSTILQALLYLHEVVVRGDADIDRTELGGPSLELGGFARIVHRHETDRTIVLRAEFATPGALERFGRDLTGFPFPDLDDEIESAWVELKVVRRHDLHPATTVVESVQIGVPQHSQPLVIIDLVGDLRAGEPLYFRVNLSHPLLGEAGPEARDAWRQLSVPEPLWHGGIDPTSGEHVLGLDDIYEMIDEEGPMPLFAVSRTRSSAVPPLNEPIHVIDDEELGRDHADTLRHIRTFLEMVVLGTTAQLASFLHDAIYIGPLRTIPPRGFLYERAGRIASWADGLAGWDFLLADRLDLIERTNAWLRRLRAGCQVVAQQLFDSDADAEEISEGHVDKTVRRLLLDTGAGSFVLPSEVGAGISQIVPVVVAALEGRPGLTLVEQPEVHVHPAMQVELGDLLMNGATREGPRRLLLIETHSEHLLLRVMRRMRQTSDGKLTDGMRAVRRKDISILIVERENGRSIARQMPLNERGELVKAWPGGFFEEGLKEVFDDVAG